MKTYVILGIIALVATLYLPGLVEHYSHSIHTTSVWASLCVACHHALNEIKHIAHLIDHRFHKVEGAEG